MMLAAILPRVANAQETVTIGTGTTTTYVTPFNSLWGYSFVEAIYTSEEIEEAGGSAGTITSISFYKSSGNALTSTIDLYMKNVTRSTFSSTTDNEPVTQDDIVYTGTFVLPATAGWVTITLEDPFFYDGSNLMVAMHEYTSGYTTQYFTYTEMTDAVVSYHSDSADPDPYNLGSYSGNKYTSEKRANIQLEISAVGLSCHAVKNLGVSDITSTDATILWNAPEDEGSYILQYKTSTHSWDGDDVVTAYPIDTIYDFSDMLSPMTTYNVRVANMCANGDTSVWRNTSFTTACAEVTELPLNINFDNVPGSTSGTTNNLPDCWNYINTGTSSSYTGYPIVYSGSATAYSGNNSLRFYTYITSGTYSDQIAILPPIDVDLFPLNTLQISFGARSASTYTLQLVVGVMTDPADKNTFVPVDTIVTTSNNYNFYDIPLSEYSGEGNYIALMAPQPTSSYNAGHVDDIIVNLIPDCGRPSNVTVNNITAHTADVTFQPASEEDYAWEYALCNASTSLEDAIPELVSNTTFELTDLTSTTNYTIYVRTVCDAGGYSDWSPACAFATEATCSSPSGLAVTQITGNSALVSWGVAPVGATGYIVAYRESEEEDWITETVAESPYMLSGLEPQTTYSVQVTAECDEGSAPAVTGTFTTHCLSGGEFQIGNGTTTNSYIPSYSLYNYAYTQELFLSSEMNGPTAITSISVEMASLSQQRRFAIYLAHTTESSLSSSWITPTEPQLVFSAQQTLTTGWNTFNFSTPFSYNGTDNLLVIFVDSTGSYVSGNTWRTHSSFAGSARYKYQDASPYDVNPPSDAGTSLSVRNNMIFGGECDEEVACLAPNAYLSDITSASVTVNWVPGYMENSWELEYKTDSETDWNTLTVSESPYTIEDLISNTGYSIRMRSICGGEEFSNWKTMQFRTECDEITVLPFTENFDSYGTGTSAYPSCWNRINNASSTYPYIYATNHYDGVGSLYFYASASGIYNIAITPPFSTDIPVNTLQATFMYRASSASNRLIVGVMTDPNEAGTFVPVVTIEPDATATTWVERVVSFGNYTGEGQYIAFKNQYNSAASYAYIDNLVIEEIPDCERPENVTVSNITAHTADVTFQPASDDDYAWEYALCDASTSLEEAVPEPVSSTTFELADLNSTTNYTLYVRTVCSFGGYSSWSTACAFATQATCSSPSNLAVTQITGNSALVSWEAAPVGATGYTVAYKESEEEDWITETVTETLYMISGLEPQTTYSVKVTSECDDGEAPAVTGTFTTHCLSGGEFQIGNGTTTATTIPSNSLWKHCYSQQIFTSSEMNGPSEINSISMNMSVVNQQRNFKIYLMHTTATDLASGWVSTTDAQMVFSGAHTFTTGWNTFNFDTSFAYNGNDNLLLIVVDSNSSYTSGNAWYTHAATSGARYKATDSAPYSLTPPSDAGTLLNVRNNIIFGGECDEEVSCLAPNAYLSDTTSISVTVNWIPGYTENSWELEYKAADETEWNTAAVSESPYIIEGLFANTQYEVRMRSVCGGDEYSNWKTMLFRTACDDISILPFTENFDSYGTGATAYPSCWSKINNASTSYPYIYATNHYDGVGSLYSYAGSSGNYNIAVTPPFSTDILVNTLQATFMYRASGATNRLIVGVMTDPNMESTFVPVDTIVPESTASTWVERIVSFENYTGEGRYIAFKNQYNTAASYAYIDNLVIQEIPECMKPTLVQVLTTTTNSVELEWMENGSATTWEIAYGTPGFDPDSTDDVVTATSVPFEVTGLNASTMYQFYVRALCDGSDFSDWSASVQAATDCGVISVPYTEDFNAYSTTVTGATAPSDYPNDILPLCWSFLNRSTTSSAYPAAFLTAYNTYAVSGNCLFFKSSSTTPLYAILPEFDADLNTLQITFTYKNEGVTTSNGTLSLGYMTNSSDASSFVELVAYPQTTTKTEITEMLNIVPDSVTGYIVFKYTGGTSNNYYLSIDNVTVENIPACASPVKNSVTATNIDGHNATISFVDNDPNHNSWTVYYRAANAQENDEWLSVVTNETSVVLSDLTAETTYNAYVITNCDIPEDEPDATQTIQFTTLVACPAPQNLAVSAISTNAATITWFSNAESFTIEYGETGFTQGSGTIVTITDTTYELTNLTSATSYTVYVTADCGVEGVSSSSSVAFATMCDAISTFPYTEGFENGGNMPVCWSQEYVTGDLDWAFQNGGHTSSNINAAHSGNYNAYIFFNSSSNHKLTRLISPILDLSTMTDAFVTFWHAQPKWTNDQDQLTVYYRTSATAEWQQLVQYTNSLTEWTLDSLVLPNPSATYQIAFEGYTSYGYGISLDDITVYATGGGPVITDPSVATNAASGVEQTVATLNASITNPDNVAVTAKGFEWKATAGGTYASINGTGTGNTFTASLANLTPNTSYTFKAFITFNGTTVYGDELTFTTLEQGVEPCDVPTGLTASNITKESFTVTWNANPEVSSWNVQYRPLNGQLSSATTNTNHYDFTNLTSETVYQVQVQANCGDNNLSEWSEILTVTTLVDGIEEYLINRIALYPNPAKEYVDIRVDENINVTGMEVYDVYGKLINTVNVVDNPTRINVSGLANGMYFVRVTTEKGVVTKQFVKR